QQGRYSRRADSFDERNRRGKVAAGYRYSGRSRSSGPRQIPHGRKPGENVGLGHQGETFPAARRAHRRNSEGRAWLQGRGDRRDQELGRSQRAEEGRKGRVTFTPGLIPGIETGLIPAMER